MKSVVPHYIQRQRRSVLGMSAPLWSAFLVILAIVMVDLIARFGLVSRLELVPVDEFVTRAIDLLADTSFVRNDLFRSLTSIAVSFVAASLGGIAIAYFMTQFRLLQETLGPYFDLFYAIPLFALYPVVVVLLGGGQLPIILLASTFSSVVVITNASVGFRALPPITKKLAVSLQLSRLQQFRLLLLPAALPDILTGLKLGMSYTIIAVLAGEFILSPQGLGHAVANAYKTFDTAGLYAGITIIAVFSLLTNFALSIFLSKFDWRRR